MLVVAMSEVTQILQQIEAGDPSAAEDLLPLVYDELRKLAAHQMAHEASDHTLQPTALVHEAYIRLVDVGQVQHWNSRGHFFAAAAEAMRRILVDAARRKRRMKHGGHLRRVHADHVEPAVDGLDSDVLAVDEALDKLARTDAPAAVLVKLRYFAGLTMEEAASVIGVAPRTADSLWAYARAWILQEIDPG
jgi:RNA polymerase sigma factor (TIGR02999 family)